MRDKTSTLSYKWFQNVWNEGLEDSIDNLMTPDCYAHGIVAPDQPKGAAGFKTFYQGFRDQFRDVHVEIEDVVSQDDMECSRADVTAVHRGTGKKVNFSGLCMIRIEDNRIAEAWNQFDFLNLYRQLGQELTEVS